EMESGPEADALPEERMEYFPGEMPRVPIRPGYRFGLFVVAGAMVLLPLIYLGVIGLIGWGMYEWAIHAGHWLFPSEKRHRLYWVMALVYVGPLLVGGILMLF